MGERFLQTILATLCVGAIGSGILIYTEVKVISNQIIIHKDDIEELEEGVRDNQKEINNIKMLLAGEQNYEKLFKQ